MKTFTQSKFKIIINKVKLDLGQVTLYSYSSFLNRDLSIDIKAKPTNTATAPPTIIAANLSVLPFLLAPVSVIFIYN